MGVRELSSEAAFIGTRIDIAGVLVINVPFPGRYASAELNIPDGNVGEPIPIETLVINKGRENLTVDVQVKFYEQTATEDLLIQVMDFQEVLLTVGNERYFRKFLDSTGYRSGNYFAESTVTYWPNETIVNESFRIGSLFVNITNFTTNLPNKGIQKFLVGIESKWNNRIGRIFADVNLSNSTQEIFIRTPPIDLDPWEQNTLTAFIDTDQLEGEYHIDIVAYYLDKTTVASGTLVVRKFNRALLISVIAFAVALILLIIILVWFIHANKKRRKKK